MFAVFLLVAINPDVTVGTGHYQGRAWEPAGQHILYHPCVAYAPSQADLAQGGVFAPCALAISFPPVEKLTAQEELIWHDYVEALDAHERPEVLCVWKNADLCSKRKLLDQVAVMRSRQMELEAKERELEEKEKGEKDKDKSKDKDFDLDLDKKGKEKTDKKNGKDKADKSDKKDKGKSNTEDDPAQQLLWRAAYLRQVGTATRQPAWARK